MLEWRSEATGRVHEVLESNSDRVGADLAPGDGGYLWFEGGKVSATRGPAAPSRSSWDRRPAGAEVGRGVTEGPRSPRRNWGRWILPASLLLAIVWQLLLAANR